MDETFASDICEGPDQLVPEGSTASFSAFDDHDYHAQVRGVTQRSSRGGSSSSGGIQFPNE